VQVLADGFGDALERLEMGHQVGETLEDARFNHRRDRAQDRRFRESPQIGGGAVPGGALVARQQLRIERERLLSAQGVVEERRVLHDAGHVRIAQAEEELAGAEFAGDAGEREVFAVIIVRQPVAFRQILEVFFKIRL